MRRPSLKGLSLLLALCANIRLTAQNLESIGKEKPISLAGVLSFDQIHYSAPGVETRPERDRASGIIHFSFFCGGRNPLNISITEFSTTTTTETFEDENKT